MKMYAVISNSIVIDYWLADSFEEAQSDNIEKTIVEITVENTPSHLFGKWDGNKFYEPTNIS